MMATMLLPGTVILYYGDEIGMSDPAQPISCLETEDPYALPPYSGEVVCLGSPPRSRDPARTPMQVGGTMSWNVVVVVAVVAVRLHRFASPVEKVEFEIDKARSCSN